MAGQSATKLLLRGRLTTFRRRWGKVGCRCATGEPHESPPLRYPEGGGTTLVTLADADVAEVGEALARYEQERAELDRAAEAGLAALQERRTAGRAGGRA
jgi:hypothetical protein